MRNPFIYSSNVRHNRSCDLCFFVKHGEIIADNLSKADWNWGGVSAVDSHGRTIWIADSHSYDGRLFVVRAEEN
jgi:hypothetical protein